jgi:hypothetical protein
MIVRLRFSTGVPKRAAAALVEASPPAGAAPRAPATPAKGLAGLLTPVSVVLAAFALWKIAADLGIAHAFPLQEGAFANWQVWFALALAVQVSAYALRRTKSSAPARAQGEGRV